MACCMFQEKVDHREISRRYESSFFEDMNKLSVIPPTVKTRVTEHIPHIIRFIQRIMDNGYAYKTSGGMYDCEVELCVVTTKSRMTAPCNVCVCKQTP